MSGFPVPPHLPEFAQVHVYCIGDVIQPSHPLLPSSLSAFSLPSIGVFSNESAVFIRWPKYWHFNFSISPSNEYSGLISSKIDWFDILALRDSQESSPAPPLKNINSLLLYLLHGPALITIRDYWKDHSLDYTDLLSVK